VCVCERERERERGRERERERENCIADRCRDYWSGHASWYRINPRNILRLRPQQCGGTAAVRPVTIILRHGCNSGINYSGHKGPAAMHLPASNIDIYIWLFKQHNIYANWTVGIQLYDFLTSVINWWDSSALRSGRLNTGGDPGSPTQSVGGWVCLSGRLQIMQRSTFLFHTDKRLTIQLWKVRGIWISV
jgi:hypothetical protein